MALKYNPLLKIGLENTGGDSSEIEAQIAALQNSIDSLQSSLNTLQSNLNTLKNSKITKVTASEQLSGLSVGEIFEWQVATTETFTQGYFYKVVSSGVYLRVDLQPNYTLPIAAANSLGGVKVGSGLNIDETGVLSITGGDSLKVPRCFSQAQINALDDNDIFQWQAATTSDYVQGYFYKKTSNTTVLIESGATYLYNDFGPYIRGNYSVQNGYYKFIEETSDIVNGYFINKNSDSTRFYCSLMPAVVGQVAIVTTQAHVVGDFIEFVTVTAVNSYGYPTEYSDGVSVYFSSEYTANNSKICKYQNVKTNDIVYFPVLPNGDYPFAFFALILDNGVYYPIGRLTAEVYVATTDITETTIIVNRVDTQPNSLSSNLRNGANIRFYNNLIESCYLSEVTQSFSWSKSAGAGWFTVAQLNRYSSSTLYAKITIFGGYNNRAIEPFVFEISGVISDISLMSFVGSTSFFTKFRVVSSDGTFRGTNYLQLYCSYENPNSTNVFIALVNRNSSIDSIIQFSTEYNNLAVIGNEINFA